MGGVFQKQGKKTGRRTAVRADAKIEVSVVG